ncbi:MULTISPECIES: restriction endonuclease subunit S [Paenibacillus]|uniref:restriction endonuclease subunit S n=1 Tax=Paenibacillus TaxID=44249 RepID=UPI0011A167FD|nr:restriction endonuclease subunit S [Paenibacillus sp. IHBB 10380]
MSFEESDTQKKLNEISYSNLPPNWKLMKVEDVSEQMKDAPFGAKLKSKDYVDYGIPVVQGRNIKNNKFEWNNKLYTSAKKRDELKNHLCYEGELVFPKVGTIGGCAILPKIEGQNEYVLSTNMMKLKANSKISDISYIYYYFSNPKIQKVIKQRSTTSVQPVFNFTSLKKFPIVVPSLTEQKLIVAVLSSIDKKIELNNAINKNLEEMAQALFKRWFIDFEFPNENGEPYKSSGGEFEESELGLIPKGWKIENFNSVFDLKYGKALKEGDRREGDVPVYGSNGRIGFHNNSLVKGPGIVVGRKGNAGTVNFVEKDFFPIDTTFYVQLKPHCISSMYYAYYELINQNLTKYSSDSAVPGLSKKMVEQNKVIIPIEEKIEEFDRSISSIFQYKSNLEDQSDKLSKIRDTLLPKLMSGEIRVPVDDQELTSSIE